MRGERGKKRKKTCGRWKRGREKGKTCSKVSKEGHDQPRGIKRTNSCPEGERGSLLLTWRAYEQVRQ